MRYLIIVGIILTTLVAIVGCTQPQDSTQGTFIDVSPAEAKELIVDNLKQYVNPDAMGAVEMQEDRITAKFREKLEGIIEDWADNGRH